MWSPLKSWLIPSHPTSHPPPHLWGMRAPPIYRGDHSTAYPSGLARTRDSASGRCIWRGRVLPGPVWPRARCETRASGVWKLTKLCPAVESVSSPPSCVPHQVMHGLLLPWGGPHHYTHTLSGRSCRWHMLTSKTKPCMPRTSFCGETANGSLHQLQRARRSLLVGQRWQPQC